MMYSSNNTNNTSLDGTHAPGSISASNTNWVGPYKNGNSRNT